ncbi:MAG: OmpA family protein [Bacteroidota bacterium]
MKRLLFFLSLCLLAVTAHSQTSSFIKSVFFGGGSYYVDEQQAAEIQQFIQQIENLEHYQISISSHTDNIGGVEYNQWLSQMRSEAVIRQLEQQQIPRDKVGRIDEGQFNPLYDNNTWEGRMANRRVDIIVTPLFL